jgi:hypothetical protein
MSVKKHAKAELNDLNDKLRDAKAAANSGAAGEREKADLKLLEQEVLAKKMKAKHAADPKKVDPKDVDAKLDKALKDSFPGSDPVSFVEAAPIKKHDRALPTVPDEAGQEKKTG